MIGIFKQKNPVNLLLLFIFGILIKMPMFIKPHKPVIRFSDGILYEAIVQFLEPASRSFSLFFPVVSFLLLFFQAAILTRFINNQRMMNRATYLPGLAYMLITSLLPEWNYFSAPLLINSILLIILSGLFRIYGQQNVRGTVFNIGVALGIASFLFVPALIFIVWILLALLIMRPFRLTEWLIFLLGITTPFYFYAIYILLIGKWSWDVFLPVITIGTPSLKQSAWLAGSVFLLMIPFLTGGYYVQENLRRMLINVRKGWSLLLLYLFAALILPFINTGDTFENWIMGTAPLAAFHACAYLYSSWRVFPLILFWLTVAFILVYQYSSISPGW